MSAECGQTCLLALLTLLLLLRLLLFDKYNYRAVEVEDHSTLKFGGKILAFFGRTNLMFEVRFLKINIKNCTFFACSIGLWFQIFGFILSMYNNFDVSN